jgi:hypothetical protein
MANGPVHRELLLPPPSEKLPAIQPLVWTWLSPHSFEIHRATDGRIRFSVSAESETSLDAIIARLESSRPRLVAGSRVDCAFNGESPGSILARAVPLQKHHHVPLGLRAEEDSAGLLIRTLGSATLREHDVALQILFRRVRFWESGFFSPGYDAVVHGHSREVRATMDGRRSEAAYHVEMRVRIAGPRPDEALTALDHWLEG